MFILVLPKLVLETLLDLVYFPVWWFTGGFIFAGKKCLNLVSVGNAHFAPGLWLSNIFVPMYGQYDFEGRLISFFMRLFQVIVRAIVLFIWILLCLVLFLSWFLLPIVTVYGFLSIKN